MKKKNSKTKTFIYIRAASYASADGLIGFAHIQVKARDELEAYSKGYRQMPPLKPDVISDVISSNDYVIRCEPKYQPQPQEK
jgi:hypothetical protein